MAENIPPNVVVVQQGNARFRIPNEVWTEVFKSNPLSRANLVQVVSPVCYCFKEICNKNVKSIHVITKVQAFIKKLGDNNAEANQQLVDLAGHNCQLASQFRLTEFYINGGNMAAAAIFRHCADLFRGSLLSLELKDNNADLINESLGYLEVAKASGIDIYLHGSLQLITFRHPTVLNCNRIHLSMSSRVLNLMFPIAVTIFFDWLHHQPIGGEDGNDEGDDEPVVRCMIIASNYHEAIEWLINQCIQNFKHSHGPMDRRRFVLSFSICTERRTARFDQFEHQNQMTGEVLLLDCEVVQYATTYRLRRCLAEEAAGNGAEFYGKLFKQSNGIGGYDEFDFDDKMGVVIA